VILVYVLSLGCFVEQTPVIWLHGIDDQVVRFSAGQAGPPFLSRADVKCEFQV
jgi:lysophospholipase-2